MRITVTFTLTALASVNFLVPLGDEPKAIEMRDSAWPNNANTCVGLISPLA